MNLVYTKQFKNDIKRVQKQKIAFEQELRTIVELLLEGQVMPAKYRDHRLAGKLSSCRDCHIRPDLLLLYQISNNDIILQRLGSHSELFR